jgi:predicted ATP-grasp superfamily ATP-dependent carboligase
MRKGTAFVTYGWCRSSYAVLVSLARKGVEVHVGDASGLAMARFSRYIRSFTRLPDFFNEPEAYVDAVSLALRNTESEVLLPCHEDVGLISQHHHRLPENVKIALPDWPMYQEAEDKFRLMEIAARAGCPIPAVYTVSSEEELQRLSANLSWPVILKTRIGNSAKGVAVAHDSEGLIEKFRFLVKTYGLTQDRWPFIQEYLSGKAVGVCALYDRGRRVAWFGEEYLRCKERGRFGTSTLRQTWLVPHVAEQALRVLDSLKWHGLAHVDLIEDKNGVFKIIEINPRPWGALALAVHAGVDFPYMWYLTALGLPSGDQMVPPANIKCRWVLGECLAFLECLKQARFSEALEILRPLPGCVHDDWRLTDPLPFFFQFVDYFCKFIKAGGSTNPITKNMVR